MISPLHSNRLGPSNLKDILISLVDSIIPISDNGGSSSELIRVFGGPGIGDVRSESWIYFDIDS